MHRIPKYILLFIVLALLQVFLLGNLNLGVWVNPLVYVAFVVLLPMETRPLWVLLTGLMMGVAMDFLLATAGLNTIAILVTAFVRRPVMMLMLGKETVGDGGTPCSARLGAGKFMRYCAALVLVHCTAFFFFEAFGLHGFLLTLLKIILSTAVTTLLIYIVQLLMRK
jgi:hypothetical protein